MKVEDRPAGLQGLIYNLYRLYIVKVEDRPAGLQGPIYIDFI